MLILIGCVDSGEVEVDFGEYLPLKIYQKNYFSDSSIYWRVGNFHTSLLEIQIDRGSGQIIAISFLAGKVVKECFEFDLSDVMIQAGWPIVDVSSWSEEEIIDEVIEFRILTSDGQLLIDFSDGHSIRRAILAGNLKFMVDEKNIIRQVLVSELPEKDLIELEAAL